MDIISYGLASKIAKQEKDTRENVLATGVEGLHPHVRERIDKLEDGLQGVVEQADKLIVQDAVNIMKAHAKLNAIAKTTKYKMHNMVFDDLLDLSGIDTTKSSGYIYETTEGRITAGANCVVETKDEVADAVPRKVIFTAETISESYGPNVIPSMTSNISHNPVVASESSKYSTSYAAWKAFDSKDDSARWQSSSIPAWIKIDFYNPKAISKYKIFGVSASGSNPDDWVFQGSNDDINWIDLNSQAGQAGIMLDQFAEYTFDNTTPYRFYRIYVTKAGNGASYTYISEIEMYEKIASEGNQPVYSVSRDNGTTWEPIMPDTLFYFNDSTSPLDSKLRLKAELPSGTKLLNYSLTWA